MPPSHAPFLDRLPALLGAGSRRLLLAAPGAAALAEALTGSGLEITTIETGVSAPATGAPDWSWPTSGQPWDAVLLLDCLGGDLPLAPLLSRAHAQLGEKGRLVVATSREGGAAPTPQEVVVALSATGFVVLPQLGGETEEQGRVVVARRDAFRVREYQDGDEAQILPVFEGSFFVPRSVERWRWEYRQNPYGNQMISEAFGLDGELVAHYAGYPVHFRGGGGGGTVTALQIGDTMTLP